MRVWQSKEQKSEVAIVSGVRTPFAKAGTKLKKNSAVQLGVTAAREAMARAELDPSSVDEVVFGNAGTPADAANISRVISLRSGLGESIPAYTVHRNCASAMEAVAQGCLKIGAGLADTMVVGGTESMSNMPLLYGEEMTELFSTLSFAKSPATKLEKVSHFRPGWLKPVVAIMEGLTDPISGLNMGQTAEVLARDFQISRETQDQYALRSHQKTVAAQKEGRFADEILPTLLEPDYDECLESDIGPRDGQTMEALAKLRPFFDRENGTITPGNACPITDGAVTLVLMNAEKAKSEGREILARISGFTFTGCEPKRMGMGPIHSTSKVLDEMGLPLSAIELVELNEAFAAQVIANQIAFNSKKYCVEKLGRSQELGELRDDILNVNGGAIALGHPVGATGARLILTLILAMKRRNLHRGLATLCIGGGQGAAFVLDRGE
ncbi:MAG: thiolase family protein [Bdellovibrionaceae bacterium]|nr:thiolase family protein [Pseudobdellovibrionaceae bacterium]